MKRLLLLLAKGFELYEASVFTDIMGWNLIDGDGTTKCVSCGLKKEIACSFGHRVVTDLTVGEVVVGEYDALAIPGGFAEYGFYDDAYSEPFLELIRSFHGCNKVIASICVGALPVAKSGILKGKRGTTYMANDVRKSELSGYGVDVANEPIVIDDNIITSWNPSTAINVALKLLELLTSSENAAHIRKIMGFAQ